ncbi:ABC transporter ATP-binding protein [Geotalea sp. SG265]|uniref:ABC transporter ATP-binding protein n=1 Tax=Geotalea sp. SG265 TaxID=2922867 RepID=UPI001FAEE77F|nr:ABC transporter ATP-binding protein [Geotalea sp. SG265]
MSDNVIQVENLWKEYRLGVINHHTLALDLQSWWARMRGKEDPNSPLAAALKPAVTEGQRFWALKDVSFDVKQGEILGIIGSNGAGKSTLLKILSQVTNPTRGKIRYKGRIASLLEVGTGFHPDLTGRENVYLNGAILGMDKDEIRNKFDSIISFAEVEKFIDTPVKRYSSGMYVRLAFAVAAHLESEILIVDEVLAVGDAQFQKKCLGKMEDAGRDGRTVLFVSHSLESIKKLCTRGLYVKNGNVSCFDDIDGCIDSYLENGTDNVERIVSHAAKFSEKLDVHQILVNGCEDNVIPIKEGRQNLTIDVTGVVHSRTRIAFEARVLESSEHVIGIFYPIHYSEPRLFLQIGHFHVRCSIMLPNLTKGEYYLSFRFTDPGVEWLIDCPRAVRLSVESEVITAAGVVLENRRGHGAIILDGSINLQQDSTIDSLNRNA